MERGSSKHGRALDEEMAKDARPYTQGTPGGSRVADGWREPEPAGEDQPEAEWIPTGARPGGAPAPLTSQELEARSRLGRWVPRTVLPASREQLQATLREANAPEDIQAALTRLPGDRSFATIYEIWEALGHRNEPTSATGT